MRVAFVHIPKTAGRSVTHAFAAALGPAHCREVVNGHITAADFADASAGPTGIQFVSGHAQLSSVTPTATRFTFLRDPIHQLASHLRWLDRYNLPMFHEEVIPFSPSIMQAIHRIGATDFTSAHAIAAFLAWLPPHSHARLIDVQCEVLSARPDHPGYTDPRELAEAAIACLPQLAFVGLTERIDRDLPRLFAQLGLSAPPLVTRQNTVSSPRRIDVTDPAIRRVLAGAVRADLILYRHVRRSATPLGRLANRWAARRRTAPAG